jgi:hypothetical protein
MAWDMGSSTAELLKDIERWKNDLAKWAADGSGGGGPTRSIRGWIAEAEKIIAGRGR